MKQRHTHGTHRLVLAKRVYEIIGVEVDAADDASRLGLQQAAPLLIAQVKHVNHLFRNVPRLAVTLRLQACRTVLTEISGKR